MSEPKFESLSEDEASIGQTFEADLELPENNWKEKALLRPEFQEFFSKCKDADAYEKAVSYAINILAHITSQEEIRSICDSLLTIDFNNKKIFNGWASDQLAEKELICDLLINFYENKLGKSLEEGKDVAIEVSIELVTNILNIYFHGTNSYSYGLVKEGDLRAQERGHEQDVEKVLKILQRIGEDYMSMGLYSVNSKDKLFVTGNSFGALKYAQSSPEWFGMFIDGSGRFFIDRDYEGAKKEIEKKIETWKTKEGNNLSQDEATTIMDFFENYWQRYASTSQIVLAVKGEESAQFITPLAFITFRIASEKKLDINFDIKNREEVMDFIVRNSNVAILKKVIRSAISHQLSQINTGLDNAIPIEKIEAYEIPKYKNERF